MRTFKACSFCGQFSILPKLKDDSKGTLYQDRIKIKTKIGEGLSITKGEYEQIIESNCHTCGESFISYHWNEEDIKAYCYELYNRFKEFVGDKAKELPDEIEIKIEDEGDVHYAGRCYYDNILGKVVVGIRKNQMQNIKEMPAIMFHEFYHIFGIYDPITKKRRIDKSHWFSEFKSSEIETKARVGWNRIDDNKMIRLYQKVYFDRSYVTLYDFIRNIIGGYVRNINSAIKHFKKFNSLSSFDVLCITRTIPYYYGTVNFIKRYLDEKYIKEIPDVNILGTLINNGLIKQTDEKYDKKDYRYTDTFGQMQKFFKDLDDCVNNGLSDEIDSKLFDKIMLDITYTLDSKVNSNFMRFDNFNDFQHDLKKKEEKVAIDDKERDRRKAFVNLTNPIWEGMKKGLKYVKVEFNEIIKDTTCDDSVIPELVQTLIECGEKVNIEGTTVYIDWSENNKENK